MTLKVLPKDVRSILCASAEVNNYKTAVAELVYNSLDAESTSIAIRVHIQENRLQVIDNGFGIAKNDFDALGQRYMTSKLTDLSTLKSMPKCYGYRGDFLANLIEISRNVKIISRHKDSEETWAKIFYEGKEKQLSKFTKRPSKGTTVEINGFLYNLNIQKRAIDPVNDLQNIKSFLEQLSIAHNNISLSLRDDSKNEIIFKIHKKRDVYQTLTTLFNIERTTVQELQVEKNQYKVKAFIGKTSGNIGKHWIYINGRFIHSNNKLQNIINKNLEKYLLIKCKKISKSKKDYDEEELFKQNLPFYFVFLTCPYIDYHVSSTHKPTVVEFRNWNQIKTMIEKLIKLYVGDIKLKKPNKTEIKDTLKQAKNSVNNEGTDNKIKNIITKILGNNVKKLGVSQLQNGVRGKLINRKNKKKNNIKNAKRPKVHSDKDSPKLKCHQDKSIKLINELQNRNINVNKNPISTIFTDANESSTYNNKGKSAIDLKQVYKAYNRQRTNIVQAGSLQNNKNTETHQNKIYDNRPDRTDVNSKVKVSKIKKKTCISKVKKNLISEVKLKRNDTYKNNKQALHLMQSAKETNTGKYFKIAAKKEECTKYNNKMGERKVASNANAINKFPRDKSRIDCGKADLFLPNTLSKYYINKYITHKLNNNLFKTTYDLVNTVLESQRKSKLYQSDYSSKTFIQHQQTDSESKISTVMKPQLHYEPVSINIGYDDSRVKCEESCNLLSGNLTSSEIREDFNKYGDIEYMYNNTLNIKIPFDKAQQSLRCEDIFKENSDILYTQNGTLPYLSNRLTDSRLTYESHTYNQRFIGFGNTINNNNAKNTEINRYINLTHRPRFITKESRDNFISSEKYKSLHKSNLLHRNGKQFNKLTSFYSTVTKQKGDESYTIEYTKSSEINCSIKYKDMLESHQSDFSVHNICDKIQSNTNIPPSPNYEPISGFGNTYSLPTYSTSSDCNVYYLRNQTKCTESNKIFVSNAAYYSSAIKHNIYPSANISTKDENSDQDRLSIVFVSEPQCIENERQHSDIEPMELCETVLSTSDNLNYTVHSNHEILNDLLNYQFNDNIRTIDDDEKYQTQTIKRNNDDDVSHHFNNTLTTNDVNIINDIEFNLQRSEIEQNIKENCIVERHTPYLQIIAEGNEKSPFNINENNFDFKNRLNFLPKGMSQIFENCGSKSACEYNLDEEYYEDIIYNDFVNDIQMQAEVYEPAIQNTEELTTKNIHKFENKVHKDSTTLVFDEISLKSARVLNQVDSKFIAAVLKEKCKKLDQSAEYLVLFDQHAVHERIRLEQNLASYFSENRWNSVPLDNITIKTTEDETLYLHNYKEKFTQLGLQWTILNKNEVLLSAIPEAVLGKNPREVDKVMKAVKNLIAEQIGVIKLQKGCISLYPKSIMDLVFSEACRYAIKFGQKLSKSDCVNLLNDLSNCKTPFQCAHGRPVMAVLVEIKDDLRDYKVDTSILRRSKLNRKTRSK